jgi:hypothetical protein
MTVAQKAQFELVAVVCPVRCVLVGAILLSALFRLSRGYIKSIPGIDLIVYSYRRWESASRGAGVTLQMLENGLEYKSISSVDEIKINGDSGFEVYERITKESIKSLNFQNCQQF